MFVLFNVTATPEFYTLSLHDALPICFLSCCVSLDLTERLLPLTVAALAALGFTPRPSARPLPPFRWHLPARSEEHTSELQSHSDLVCRLLLEKKKHNHKEHQPRQRAT